MNFIKSIKQLWNIPPNKFSSFNHITMDLIDSIFSIEFDGHLNIVHNIMNIDDNHISFVPVEERALPGNTQFKQTGYFKTMLKRYFFAGAFFCKDKDVLDSCSGLGWGTYILSQYADSVTAFDLEKQAVAFSKKTWGTKNIHWLEGNALNTSFLGGECFDAITGMETIEHFSKSEGKIYIEQMRNVLRDKGVFIGTSSFPHDRKTADDLCSKNPHHKYIFTLSEMNELLKSCFSEYIIIDRWMFIAKR